eukprot:TRINITY_DN19825_c0_g1_i1.p1 TRINITY_DN19825_c0_g1~~TRINITY_DN19825_c0_g1_i1.p1  ORF type:complete len:222 (+),score=43.24 TRINITY_DN19825_c0_g1_i1:291-956(+)
MQRPGRQGIECASSVSVLDLSHLPPLHVAARGRSSSEPEAETSKSWSWQLQPAPTQVALLVFGAIGVVNGKLIVAGGESEHGVSDECWCFDPELETWEEIASLPEPRSAACFCVHPTLGLVLAGGRDGDGASMSNVVALSDSSSSWRTLASLQVSRLGGAMALCQGSLYAIAGATDQSDPFTKTVERYIIEEDRWKTVERLSFPKAFHACFAFGVSLTSAD